MNTLNILPVEINKHRKKIHDKSKFCIKVSIFPKELVKLVKILKYIHLENILKLHEDLQNITKLTK
jgi:uncharacterized protein YfeS